MLLFVDVVEAEVKAIMKRCHMRVRATQMQKTSNNEAISVPN